MDNVFNFISLIKIKLNQKRNKVFAFFLDLPAAFDTIDRYAMVFKLYELGLSTRIVRIIQTLYDRSVSGVWCKEGISEF